MAPSISKQLPPIYFEPRPFACQTRVALVAPSTIVYDKKFDTALRASHLEQHYQRVCLDDLTRDDQLTVMLKNYPERMVKHNKSVATHANIMTDLVTLVNDGGAYRFQNSGTANRTTRMINLAFDNCEFQLGYLLEKTDVGHTRQNVFKQLRAIRYAETRDLSMLNALLDYADFMLGVVNMSNGMYADGYRDLPNEEYVSILSAKNTAYYKPLDLEISWGHQYCVVRLKRQCMLLPKSYLLMLHNKACDLISVLVYVKLARHSSLPKNMDAITINFCSELWNIIRDYGQLGFNIVKCLEAFASGEALCACEQWENKEFLHTITKDLAADTGFTYYSSSLRTIWKKLSIPAKHELACLSKVAGHPFVEMHKGAKSIHDYTTESYILNYDKINECVCYVKQNYIRNHFARHGFWPPHEITSKYAPLALRDASMLSLDPEGEAIREKHGELVITDYNFVNLLPSLKFNNLENVIPFLKDKTVSDLRSHVIQRYINQQEMKTSWSDTRLLLYYLLSSSTKTDHLDFLNRYAAGEDIEEFLNYLVIRIVPKEKELKVNFRGFGCTTPQNRILLLAQEKNAMHYLDLYSDEQAMTLSELDLTKRLFTFRTLRKAYTRHHVLYIMIDADKWNNHFRRETCDFIMAQTLDPIFATRVFGRTHERYSRTLFYVPDGDDTYHWDGQDGGIEGLNQDTWVITYIAQIKTALAGLDLKFHLLCKGDDLRLAVMIPYEDERAMDLGKTKEDILKRLSVTAAELGHKIKIYESYGSTRYFNFSKSASVDTTELPQVFRKIQKCYGATNAFLPSIDEYIGSTFSNAHSACRVSTNHLPCYFVALFWSFYYLLSDERTRPRSAKVTTETAYESGQNRRMEETTHYTELSDVQLLALSLVPSAFGGFPIIYLHNMMVRSESDLVAPFLDLMDYAKRSYRHPLHLAMKNFVVYKREKISTWKPVYKDIYCLPIDKPTSPAQVLRRAIVPALRAVTQCEDLMELFDAIENDDASIKCIKSLDAGPTVEAKVASIIYSALPEAILGEIVKKFESARSVLELLIIVRRRRRANQILREVVLSDVSVQRWRVARVQGDYLCADVISGMPHYDPCPAKFAYQLRCAAWRKPINGITMAPVAHLTGYVTQVSARGNTHIASNHFEFHVKPPTGFIAERDNYHFGVGNLSPFLGHSTGTGTLNPRLNIVEKDPILIKLRNLAELATWTDITQIALDGQIIPSNVRLLIAKITKLYTNVDLDKFAPFLGERKSGTRAHHLRTRNFQQTIMPNSLSNVYQFIQGESNAHRKFAGDKEHYWVNFLQIFCHAVCLITIELNVLPYFTVPEVIWVPTVNCDFCMRPVIEDPVIIDEKIIEKVRFNPLNITRMGASAIRVLQESIGLASGRRYNIEGHRAKISVKQATQGLLRLVVDRSINQVARLTDRYSQHPQSSEGLRTMKTFSFKTKARIIGIRELTCMDNETLVETVPYLVLSLMLGKFSALVLKTMPESLLSIPSNHLPWYPLLEEFSKVGRVVTLLEELATRANTTATYIAFKSQQSAPFLGAISLEVLPMLDEDMDVVILSNLELVDIRRDLYQGVFAKVIRSFVRKMIPTEEDSMNPEAASNYRLSCIALHVLLDYVTKGKLPEVHEDDDVCVSRQISIAELYPQDSWQQGLEEILAGGDFDLYRKTFGDRVIWFTNHSSKYKRAELYDYLYVNADILGQKVAEWLDTNRLNIVVTTAAACIDTIRTLGVPFHDREGRQTDFDVEANRSNNALSSLRPNFSDFNSCSFVPLKDKASRDARVDNLLLERQGTRLIHQCHLFRPFGKSNSTMNHLLEILDATGISSVRTLRGISVCCLGDGIGNGASVLAKISIDSRFVWTTKPDDMYIDTYPDVAMHDLERNGHVLYNDHMQQGIWDLRMEDTYETLHSLYGGHDIYFCDAEPTPAELGNFSAVHYNVAEYFVRSRRNHSILIMQVYTPFSEPLARLITFLARHCLKIRIIQPKSVKCVYMLYVVAHGASRPVSNYTRPQDLFIPESIALRINKYVAKIQSNHRRVTDKATAGLYLESSMMSRQVRSQLFPPIWPTLFVKLFNRPISDDCLTSFRLDASSDVRPGQWKCWRFVDMTLAIRALEHELAKETQPMNVAYYRSMHHTARVYRLTVMYRMIGFQYALKHFKNGVAFIPEKIVRRAFMDSLDRLSRRDYKPEHKYIGMFTKHMKYDESSISLPYWTSFIDGCELFQTLIAWLAVVKFERNSYDEAHPGILEEVTGDDN